MYVMRFVIWYHQYNFKNGENFYRGVLLLVRFQAFSCFFSILQMVANRHALSHIMITEIILP